MKRKTKRTEPLVPTQELCGPTPGSRGHRVEIGRTMSCPPYQSPSLQVQVPRRTGKVCRIYKRGLDPRILVDLRIGCGIHTVEASRLRRSSASAQ